jgi:hypothetical protein
MQKIRSIKKWLKIASEKESKIKQLKVRMELLENKEKIEKSLIMMMKMTT